MCVYIYIYNLYMYTVVYNRVIQIYISIERYISIILNHRKFRLHFGTNVITAGRISEHYTGEISFSLRFDAIQLKFIVILHNSIWEFSENTEFWGVIRFPG